MELENNRIIVSTNKKPPLAAFEKLCNVACSVLNTRALREPNYYLNKNSASAHTIAVQRKGGNSMAELKCAVQNCSYNANERCSKGDIMVGGKHASCSAETCCESFTEKKGDSFKSAVEHPSEYISIDCEAAK